MIARRSRCVRLGDKIFWKLRECMRGIFRAVMVVVASFFLASCAGYRWGGTKPPSLVGVKKIAVPMMKNQTQFPRAEAVATSSLVDEMLLDGTYRVVSVDDADAVLYAQVDKISYGMIRSSRYDTLVPDELQMTVVISWRLVDGKDPTKELAVGGQAGMSRFFTDANLQTARNNALPDAVKRASVGIVSRLANGY